MSTTVALPSTPAVADPVCAETVRHVADELRDAFGSGFSIWDADGELLHACDDQRFLNCGWLTELTRSVAKRRQPEFLLDADCLLVFAIPIPLPSKSSCVAVAAFATRRVDDAADVSDAARALVAAPHDIFEWIHRQPAWSAEMLLRLGTSVMKMFAAEAKVERYAGDVETISRNLAHTYEEISLLYTLTQNLRISSTDEVLGRLALDWLSECVPAQGLAILYLPVTEDGDATYDARTKYSLLRQGDCPLDCGQLAQLIETLRITADSAPLVANYLSSPASALQYLPLDEETLAGLASVEQLVIAPLAEGDNLFGWIAALNHRDGEEFGSVEANLLNSVGSILGIHSGNLELYRKQREFLADVVQALTSAIDAKDPYTCGHSDRVARISVRLAKELGFDQDTLNTLYMAGLLHDIGKIGIDDNVLRKPGRLTDAEYEHIKLHPALGYKILADIKPLADVLPVVLYHHEEWNGSGYPHGLAGEDIPVLARIAAVADAYDAMTSDRPYRKGMPVAKVDAIFREGAAKQWDQQVIDAYFAVHDEISEISRNERGNLSLNVKQWT